MVSFLFSLLLVQIGKQNFCLKWIEKKVACSDYSVRSTTNHVHGKNTVITIKDIQIIFLFLRMFVQTFFFPLTCSNWRRQNSDFFIYFYSLNKPENPLSGSFGHHPPPSPRIRKIRKIMYKTLCKIHEICKICEIRKIREIRKIHEICKTENTRNTQNKLNTHWSLIELEASHILRKGFCVRAFECSDSAIVLFWKTVFQNNTIVP